MTLLLNPSLPLAKGFSCNPALYDSHLRRCVLQTFWDFDYPEWHFLVLQPLVNLIGRLVRLTAKSHLDIRAKGIRGLRGVCVY